AAAYQSQDTEGLTEGVAVVGPGLAVADTSFLRTGLGTTNQLEGLGTHVVSTEVGGVALADHGRVEELGRGPSDANFGVTSPVVVTVVAAHVVRDGGGDPFGGLGIGASGFQGDESVDGDTPVGHVTDRSGKSAVDEFSGQPLGGGGRSPRMSGFGGHGGGGGGGRRRRHRPGRARKVFGGYRSRGVLRDEPTVRGSPRARHGGCAHRPWVRPHVQTMTVGGL